MISLEEKNIKVLVSVDLQKDFCDKDGKLYVPEAEDIKPKVAQLIKYAEDNNIPILSTIDWHTENDPEFKTFPPHCITQTEGIKPIPESKSNTPPLYFTKMTYDIFDVKLGNPGFGKYIVDNKVDVAIVMGVATDYCVKAAVMGLLKLKTVDVYVVIDAIKGVNEKTTMAAINEMKDAGASFIGVCSII